MMKKLMFLFFMASNCLHAENFPYDKKIAVNYSTLLAKDILRLEMPDYVGKIDFSNHDAYAMVDKNGRKFVFVTFMSQGKDGFFLIVSEVCGFDGLGIQRYFYADFGMHTGDPIGFKNKMINSQKNSTLKLPVGCPGWYTQSEFEQPE